MKDRNKRNLTIGILCCLLVFMGVGFAVMNATLNINGTATAINTWDVRMTNIEVIEKSEGTTNQEETKINEDGISANFKTDFTKPGDFITYKVTIENKGSIDAVLNDISITLNVSEADKDLFNITDTRPNNQLLEAGTSTTFTIKVEFRSDAYRMPSGDIEYIVKVDYSQQTGEIGGSEEDWTFKVDESGTLIAYNYEKGTDVVIPAEVDGIPVKAISSNAFSTEYNVAIIPNEFDNAKFVIFDEENYDVLKYVAINNLNVLEKDIFTFEQAELNGFSESDYLMFNINLSNGVASKDAVGILNVDLSEATNLESINDGAFMGSNILNFTSSTNLRNIGVYAFSASQLPAELVIPEGVESIGYQAFFGTNINILSIPSTIRRIANLAFLDVPLNKIIINMTQTDFESNVEVGSSWCSSDTIIEYLQN